ncbi:V-type ATP synthase subunit I [Patescibacteria group bacterium]|nr:V-type ATP synthase subunit I [Patescibacteria group bacterium]MBU1673492.1 V-type ATP synthase subunit I [Patescibacteria group bacterium]MBU1963762.1 V-type ATP synthase subunit I [Patescibacteria group bacterium]
MAVNPVSKINLISLNRHKDQIIDLLHKAGVVQILESEESREASSSDVEYNLAQVNFALKFLKKYEAKLPLKKKIQQIQEGGITITEKQYQEIIDEFDYKGIIEEISDLEAEVNQQTNNITKYQSDIEALTMWKGLDFNPAELGETEYTNSIIGGLDKDKFEEFLGKIKKIEKSSEIIKITEDDKKQYLVIVTEKQAWPKMKSILSDYSWEDANIPHPDQKPADAISELEKNVIKAEKEIESTKKKIQKYAKHDKNMKVIFDYLSWQLEKNEAGNSTSRTEDTFALMAWMEKDHIELIKKEIEKFTKQYTIDELPIKEDENVPVPLKNKKLFYPFEMVTGIYGMPLSKEPDPTPYLTGFFLIFFGMCLTDAGYGAILALTSFLAIKIFKIPPEKSKLFKVLIWGGLFTFVIGALFGGWFGIILDQQLPAWLGNFLMSIRIIDPIANPITVLIITLIMGIIQILFGIGIAMFHEIKAGRAKDGILDHGSWMFFIIAVMFWITTMVGVLPESLGKIALYIVYAGIAILILTQGRKEKNIIMKLLKGIGSLYGLVGYFSDVLSYSRLLALGLATGIIAMVVNLIALLVVDMVPYVGWFIAIFIFIGGHLFNMVINVLGAFIHSSRLQFVEFFGKFMEGGGSRFKPLRKEAKFINIVSK